MKTELIYKIQKIDWSFLGVLQLIGYTLITIFIDSFNYVQVKENVLIAMAIAITIDTITGWSKAKALGVKPSSREGWRGIYGKILGILLLGAGTAILKLLGINITIFLNTCLVLLTVYEVYSAFGNLYTVRTGKKVEEYDAMSMIIKLFLDKLKELGDVLVKKSKQKDE